MDQANTVTMATCEFPRSAQWVSLVDTKQTLFPTSLKEKLKTMSPTKTTKNVTTKAFGLFQHGHIQKLEFACNNDKVHFQNDCLPEMKKNLKYNVKLHLLAALIQLTKVHMVLANT